MFDWFRKKKQSEPDAPADDIMSRAEDVVEAEARADDDSTQPNEAAPPAEDASEPAVENGLPESPENSMTAEENTWPEPEAESGVKDSEEKAEEESEQIEPPKVKKGFFSLFRKKFSDGEADLSIPAESEEPQIIDEAPAEPEESVIETESEAAPEERAAQHPTEEAALKAPALAGQAETAPEEGPEPDEVPEPANIQEPEEDSEGEAAAAIPSEASPQDGEDGPKTDDTSQETSLDEEEERRESKGIFNRFKEKLAATRSQLAGRIENLLSSVRTIDNDLLDELEELLITSDLGIKTTGDLLYKIRGQVASQELNDVEALRQALKKRIREMVGLPNPPRPKVKPAVIMVVGINGVGKTTTIAKLARRFKENEGQKVLLAAGDTFRSAAVDQLVIWAERLGVDIVSQPTGSDASAVVFDALNAARARGSDVVIIDTAGRLHTKVNLMEELKKIKRVANKAFPGAPHHTILVLDGNTGQNAMRQAQTFHEAVGVDSIIVTKLDGTAKGGVIVSICNELKIPIAFVGLGESFEDLQPFDPEAFTEAILAP